MKLTYIVSLFGQNKGYAVKYSPLPKGVLQSKAQGNYQKGKAPYLTVHPELSYNTELFSFCIHHC